MSGVWIPTHRSPTSDQDPNLRLPYRFLFLYPSGESIFKHWRRYIQVAPTTFDELDSDLYRLLPSWFRVVTMIYKQITSTEYLHGEHSCQRQCIHLSFASRSLCKILVRITSTAGSSGQPTYLMAKDKESFAWLSVGMAVPKVMLNSYKPWNLQILLGRSSLFVTSLRKVTIFRDFSGRTIFPSRASRIVTFHGEVDK